MIYIAMTKESNLMVEDTIGRAQDATGKSANFVLLRPGKGSKAGSTGSNGGTGGTGGSANANGGNGASRSGHLDPNR